MTILLRYEKTHSIWLNRKQYAIFVCEDWISFSQSNNLLFKVNYPLISIESTYDINKTDPRSFMKFCKYFEHKLNTHLNEVVVGIHFSKQKLSAIKVKILYNFPFV